MEVYTCMYELTYKVRILSDMFETSQNEASFTVQARPLMGLVKKKLPGERERQRLNCSSNIEIIQTLLMFFLLKIWNCL